MAEAVTGDGPEKPDVVLSTIIGPALDNYVSAVMEGRYTSLLPGA